MKVTMLNNELIISDEEASTTGDKFVLADGDIICQGCHFLNEGIIDACTNPSSVAKRMCVNSDANIWVKKEE